MHYLAALSSLPSRSVFLVPALAMCVLASALSHAQGSASAVIEEILVTATKKAELERAQDVPISILAFSGDQLEAARVDTISDVGSLVPNTLLHPNPSVSNGSMFSIRGTGTASSIPSDDPAVGVFVDGVVLGVLNGGNLDAFDLASVEVLRGPQGTLFGRNVTAGAILMRTERPSFDPAGDLRLTFGTDGRADVSAKATGPLVEDLLAARLSLTFKSTDGYFKNKNRDGAPLGIVLGHNAPLDARYGASESYIVRPSLRITPNENLSIDLIAEFQETDGSATAAQKATRHIAGNIGLPDLGRSEEMSLSTIGINEYQYHGLVVDAVQDTRNGSLSLISGYRKLEQFNLLDPDGSAVDLFVFYSDPRQDQFSQEVRWSGNPWGSDSLELTLGGYYFTQEIDYVEGRRLLAALLPEPITQGLGGVVEHNASGLFTQAAYNLTHSWVANLGLRYTHEEKDAKITVGATCDPVTRECVYGFEDDEAWSNLSWALSLQYFSSDSRQWYASAKRGFRSGGFNIRNSSAFLVPPKYDEEVVDAVELGVKSDLSQRLRFNAAVFFNRFDDLQRIVIQPDASQRVQNAAQATIKGLELDLAWLVTDRFSVVANLGLLDGKYDQLADGALRSINNARVASQLVPGGLAPMQVGDLRLARLPDLTASFTAILDQPLGDLGSISYRLGYSYVDERAGNDTNIGLLPSYSELDASLTFVSADDRWQLTVFGKNILDEAEAYSFLVDISIYSNVIQSGLPARYGVELAIRL